MTRADGSNNCDELIGTRPDAHIQRLPFEVITQIFSHFVETQQPFSQGYDSRFSKSECSAPLVLSSVCRLWRDIVLGLPRLWASPKIFLRSEERLSSQREILRQWLQRSGKVPLRISIFCPSEWKPEGMATLLRLLDAKRLKTLCLIVPKIFYPVIYQTLTEMPSLQCLELFPLRNDREGPLKFVLPDSAEVLELRIQNILVADVRAAWGNLTVFEMKHIDTDEAFEVLRRATRLQKCTLIDITRTRPRQVNYAISLRPLVHQCLNDLELHSSDAKELEFILLHLELPSLEHFVFSDTTRLGAHDGPHVLPLHPLLSFFALPQRRLKTLEIHGPYEEAANGELMEVLECTPYLKHLALGTIAPDSSKCWLSDAFFTDHANFVSLSKLLPGLASLHISGRRSFSWDALLAFLNLAHMHITATKRRPLEVRLDVDSSSIPLKDYVSRDVSSQLKERMWGQAIWLSIVDSKNKEDLLETSLEYHGLVDVKHE
ncbi:hypothetical protein CVT26_004800 [Gymnopilus dilepis]|uniref:Uncharacterized protein n=1 Tax=Gymnopilus dilepis TaxID=231916 RepID=A0A409XZF5_9AGAR|nr:hypothetical protein CVT26_004800 [Gymnopilus dilepis]